MKAFFKKLFIKQWFYHAKGFKELIEFGSDQKIFDHDTKRMLLGVMNITNLRVRDIMVPRAQMNVITLNSSVHEAIRIIMDTKHSRYPVLNEQNKDIVGILLAKDLLSHQTSDRFDQLLRPPMLTPEGKRVDSLLHEFQIKRTHMSIVLNEYGEVSGLVTIEDIFEEIFGEIDDEHDADDHEETAIVVKTPNCYHVSGVTPIDAFNDFFSTRYPEDEFFTIAGLITQRLGRIPKTNEVFIFDKFSIKVLASDQRRLKKMEFTIKRS